MKRLFRCLAVVLAVLVLFTIPAAADSYTYNYMKEAVPTPEAVSVHIYADDTYAGWGKLNEASDLAIDADGNYYVADSGNNRIVILDKNCKYVNELSLITYADGAITALSQPSGVYVASDGNIYIADTGNARVLVMDKKFNIIRELSADKKDVYKDEFTFIPIKVAADRFGRTYVISQGVYDGIMEFDPQGNFLGFTGAPPVSVTLSEIFWNWIGTEEQREQRLKFIPVEFDNIDMDYEDFVYTVTSNVDEWTPAETFPVRKQTAEGNNILKSSPVIEYPIGDIEYLNNSEETEILGPSKFVDVSASEPYGYACLDAKRNRIFVYNDDGEILFIFGGIGTTEGLFSNPVAVACHGTQVSILDKESGSITVFEYTDYAKLIIEAQSNYIDGKYDISREQWKQVLKINSNLDMAYSGIGKIMLRDGEYEEVLDYFEYAGNKKFYSKAYKYYRDEWLANNFLYIVIVFAVIIILAVLYVKVFKKKLMAKEGLKKYAWYRGLKYGGYIITHPFDGFWCMIREKRGNIGTSIILYVCFIFTMLIRNAYTGFLFQPLDSEFSMFETLLMATVPLLLWCVCNWAVTTLFDGDGRFIDIVMATSYILIPFMIFSVPVSIASNFVTVDEGSLLYMLENIGLIWSGFLLFTGMLTIHNYTPAKTIGTIVVSVIGMGAVLFLVVLLFNLLQQMFGFVVSIYSEITIRM